MAIHLHKGTDLDGAVDIDAAGTFSGVATIQVGDDAYVDPTPTSDNDQSKAVQSDLDTLVSPDVPHTFNNGGNFSGNFYGPRTAADFEIAGSWHTGLDENPAIGNHWSLFGSFGAKQRQ